MALKRVPAVLLLLLVVPCAADEFQLAINQGLMGMSDTTRSPGGTEGFGDGIYRFEPVLSFTGENEVLDYFISYAPYYSRYIRAAGRDGWDHFVRANAILNPTRADRLTASIQVSDYRASRTSVYTTPEGATEFVGEEVGEILQVRGSFRLDHTFSGQSRAATTFSYFEYDYTSPDNTDNRSLGLAFEFLNALTPRLILGASFDTNYRVFMAQSGEAFRFQTTVNPNAIAQYKLNSSWGLSLNIGPSVIFSQDSGYSGFETSRFGAGLMVEPQGPQYYNYDGCVESPDRPGYLLFGQSFCRVGPGFASVLTGRLDEEAFVDLLPGEPQNTATTQDLTYFMNASLRHEGQRGAMQLLYVRREDASQGNASTSVLDQVAAIAEGEFSERWRWELNAGWYQRIGTEPLTQFYLTAKDSGLVSDPFGGREFPIAEAGQTYVKRTDQLVKTAQVWADGRLVRNLSRKMNLVLRLRYERWLELFLKNGPAPLYGNVIGELRIDYYFDPFLF